MPSLANRCLIVLEIAISLSGIACAEERKTFVFSSKDFGFPEIETTITFTPQSERTFRVEYSKPPAHPDLLMFYTYLYMCTARKIAMEQGFDRFGILPEQDQTQSGTSFFLKRGEEAAQALGPRFANASALEVTYPTVAAGCDAKSQAKQK